MDTLFLRQVWAGNETLLLDLRRRRDAARAGAPARASCRTRGRGCASTRTGRSCPASAEKPPAGELLSGGRHQGRGRGVAEAAARGEQRAGAAGFFTTIRRGPDGKLHGGALQRRVPGRAGAGGAACCARRRALTAAADAARVPRGARGGLPLQRLLRQRRGLDGAGRQHRADHRALRGLRGRLVQRQGGVRGVHHRARRRRDGEAGEASAASCRTSRTTCPSTPSCATRSSARWRPSAWSTRSSARATPTAACRPPPSTCPTTSASPRRRAPSA